jgi:hypothetical protein
VPDFTTGVSATDNCDDVTHDHAGPGGWHDGWPPASLHDHGRQTTLVTQTPARRTSPSQTTRTRSSAPALLVSLHLPMLRTAKPWCLTSRWRHRFRQLRHDTHDHTGPGSRHDSRPGVTSVTITATDDAGNTDTCSADFTVTDDTDPVISACAAGQSASADANCEATVPDFTSGVTASDNCDDVTHRSRRTRQPARQSRPGVTLGNDHGRQTTPVTRTPARQTSRSQTTRTRSSAPALLDSRHRRR